MKFISNYDDAFKFVDYVLDSPTTELPDFHIDDDTDCFSRVFDSYDSYSSDSVKSQVSRSHAEMLSSYVLGYPSVASRLSRDDKTVLHRYTLSFLSIFSVLDIYVSSPRNYFVYNVYSDTIQYSINRNLFCSNVNLTFFYRSKICILHNYIPEKGVVAPVLTILSPCDLFDDFDS